ncbi:hypothetical protein IAD21_03727 [Abditibacteriota bacterium]|nr:hypothetical protein IAD21_03727 [Abditibacteriota bacterium]
MQTEENQDQAGEEEKGWLDFGERLALLCFCGIVLFGLLWIAVTIGLSWGMSRIGCC